MKVDKLNNSKKKIRKQRVMIYPQIQQSKVMKSSLIMKSQRNRLRVSRIFANIGLQLMLVYLKSILVRVCCLNRAIRIKLTDGKWSRSSRFEHSRKERQELYTTESPSLNTFFTMCLSCHLFIFSL